MEVNKFETATIINKEIECLKQIKEKTIDLIEDISRYHRINVDETQEKINSIIDDRIIKLNIHFQNL